MAFATASAWVITGQAVCVSGDSIRHAERLTLATAMEEVLRPLADAVAASGTYEQAHAAERVG
jgi:hypothetical protein